MSRDAGQEGKKEQPMWIRAAANAVMAQWTDRCLTFNVKNIGEIIARHVPVSAPEDEPEYCNAGPSRNIPIEEMRAVIAENEVSADTLGRKYVTEMIDNIRANVGEDKARRAEPPARNVPEPEPPQEVTCALSNYSHRRNSHTWEDDGARRECVSPRSPARKDEYFATGYTREDLAAMHPNIKLKTTAEQFLAMEENKTGMSRRSNPSWGAACQFAEAYAAFLEAARKDELGTIVKLADGGCNEG